MIDCILYVKSFSGLVEALAEANPSMLSSEDGEVVVVGLARTPAAVSGDELMVYARLSEDDMEAWAGDPFVEAWGATPFDGAGTADKVYSAVLSDSDTADTYKRIYPAEPISYEFEGETITYTPPIRFGALAGA